MAAPTTSGTTNFKLDILQICEEAFERAGGEMRTGYDLRSARRSLELLALEWVNRGINLWTVTEAKIDLVSGTKTYTLADDCIDILDAAVRSSPGVVGQTDFALTRLSVSTYAQTSNKNTSSRPTSMYVDRQNLKGHYEEQYELMASEDRSKASLLFTPLQDFIDVDLA